MFLSIVFFVIGQLVGRWSGFTVIITASWLIGSAALIWLVLCLQFHQRSLAEQEKLDMGRLVEGRDESAIFGAKDEHAGLFAVAQSRLQLFQKWFIPIFSAIIAFYQTGMGLYLLKSIKPLEESNPKDPLICAICMMAIAFVSFLMSRYATGMSAQRRWKPLRAGGSSLLGVAVVSFTLAVGLAFMQFKIFFIVKTASYVIPALLIVLGAETFLNIVLDIYRPRMKGQYSRSAFDSRLLGVLNEPGEILHTAAGAIDYQFGFQVSQTWFYKLLEKAIVPLVLFAALMLYSLSCIVIVEPNEEAIIERFGNPGKEAVGPGLTFKLPWPVSIAYKYPVKKISQLAIGYVPKEGSRDHDDRSPRLWGKSHYKEEYNLLVAVEQEAGNSDEGAVPVSLVAAAIPVQYRVKDLRQFLYNHSEPEKLLESICYRELTKLAASSKIEVGQGANMERSLLGEGRAEAKRVLTERIQTAADNERLGIEIAFLGLQDIHPPPDVASSYQQVIGAVQTKQAIILTADAAKNRILSTLAGSVGEADQLYALVGEYQRAKEQNDSTKAAELEKSLDAAFTQAKGDIFNTLREAKSYAFEKVIVARSTGQRFASQLKAYNAAKDFYKKEQRLTVFEEGLANIRKYIVVGDKEDMQVFTVDLTEKLTPNLYELGGYEESSEK